ncbi:MAG: hypothetical protein ACKVS9_15405 [Phycisphaerae bacterium]
MMTRLCVFLEGTPGRPVFKLVELPFVPMVGMTYHDGTWKVGYGKTITAVDIENEGELIIEVALGTEPDMSYLKE